SARAPERWPSSAGRLQVDGSHAFRVEQEASPGGTIPYVNWHAHSSEGDRPFQAKATTCSS
ncbi:MAG: hypothetical protein WBL39_21335, partial [Terrimicrobiaceae bacterium]